MSKGTLSLGFAKSSDRRKPTTVVVSLQDEECRNVAVIDLDEHQFALLISGSMIDVEYESEVL